MQELDDDDDDDDDLGDHMDVGSESSEGDEDLNSGTYEAYSFFFSFLMQKQWSCP